MYSNTALMNCTMAMMAAPNAKEPVWYLKKKNTHEEDMNLEGRPYNKFYRSHVPGPRYQCIKRLVTVVKGVSARTSPTTQIGIWARQ